ncbi:helix-turn-helix domain-containing protein [Parageobacillus toebii]|uniref:helix-turn-helix domain-containing protein n=1 Tax=Parageobacillus toebii TaxID=153151 RepID=UPI001F3CD4C8|nr:winged helix-turn-helix domain-containing protein [Parageobacillus toebii]
MNRLIKKRRTKNQRCFFASTSDRRPIDHGRLSRERSGRDVEPPRQSVSTYVQLFNEGGLEKLLDKKTPPGKSPYLTEEQQKKLKHMILHSTPFEQGLGMAASWNTRIIQSYLQNQYGISMTRAWVNKMLYRLGLSYTRPTYTLAKGDEQKQRAFVQEMEMIKKTDGRRYGCVVCGRNTYSFLSSIESHVC